MYKHFYKNRNLDEWIEWFDGDEDKAIEWSQYFRYPNEAAEWHEYFENPEEAYTWSKCFEDPFVAYKWARHFDVLDIEQACICAEYFEDPETCKLWLDFSEDISEAREWSSWFEDPDKAKEWREYFDDPKEAYDWSRYFNEASEAYNWYQVFSEPEEAIKWMHSFGNPREAYKWYEYFDYPDVAYSWSQYFAEPSLAAEWADYYDDPSVASEWAEYFDEPEEAAKLSNDVWRGWVGDVYYMPEPGQLVWCARYSDDIKSDLKRGFSFAGWSLRPAASETEAWREGAEMLGVWDWEAEDEEEALERAKERLEERGYFVAEVDGKYLLARDGLSVFVGTSPEDAAEVAREDGRFGEDIPLWVFLAKYLYEDEDSNVFGFCARVEVVAETYKTLRRV